MDKDDAIEKIDEQIDKLKKKEPAKPVEKTSHNTTTKIFDLDEDATKVFDKDELVESKTEEVELLEDLLETKKEEVVVEKVEEKTEVIKKKKSKKPLIIIIISILIVLVLCFFILSLIGFVKVDKPEVEETVKLTEKQKEDLIKKYGEALESVIGVYYSKDSVLLEYDDAIKLVEFNDEINCEVHEIYKNGNFCFI